MENHLPPGTANERTAAFIRGKMAEQRKTATDLAGILGISRQAAGRKIDGTVTLNLDACQIIAEWLDVPIQQLVQPATDLY